MNFKPDGTERRTIRTVLFPTDRSNATIVRVKPDINGGMFTIGRAPEWIEAVVHWVDVTYSEPHTGVDILIQIFGNLLDPMDPNRLGHLRELSGINPEDREELVRKVLEFFELTV